MGGYARFVWSAIGVTAVVLVLNVWSAGRRFRRIQEELAMRARAREENEENG